MRGRYGVIIDEGVSEYVIQPWRGIVQCIPSKSRGLAKTVANTCALEIATLRRLKVLALREPVQRHKDFFESVDPQSFAWPLVVQVLRSVEIWTLTSRNYVMRSRLWHRRNVNSMSGASSTDFICPLSS